MLTFELEQKPNCEGIRVVVLVTSGMLTMYSGNTHRSQNVLPFKPALAEQRYMVTLQSILACVKLFLFPVKPNGVRLFVMRIC